MVSLFFAERSGVPGFPDRSEVFLSLNHAVYLYHFLSVSLGLGLSSFFPSAFFGFLRDGAFTGGPAFSFTVASCSFSSVFLLFSSMSASLVNVATRSTLTQLFSLVASLQFLIPNIFLSYSFSVFKCVDKYSTSLRTVDKKLNKVVL